MEKVIKIIAAVTALLASVCEVMKQINSYNENKAASSHNAGTCSDGNGSGEINKLND